VHGVPIVQIAALFPRADAVWHQPDPTLGW